MKLIELFSENYKNNSPDQAELDFTGAASAPTEEPADVEAKRYNILINGKIWKKRGESKPVVFDSFISAKKAVRTIITKYNKTAQVVIAQKKDL
jgi:hypothetical protein